MSIREIAQTFHNFCRNISHRFPSFFSLLLPEFREKATRNSGKSYGKFGQKQWENLGKSNEKTRKAAAYSSGKTNCFCPNFPLLFPEFSIAFPRISPLFFPEVHIAFARISHCFCPNFSFSIFLGAQCPPAPPPPPPPTPMVASFSVLGGGQDPKMTDRK